MIQFATRFVLAICSACLLAAAPSDQTKAGLPTDYTRNSDYQIRYDDWELILSGSVLDVGPSDRRAAGRSHRMNGTTRIRHSNSRATAFEGNRVLFSEFRDEHVASLLAIRKDLEAIPDYTPLEEFDRFEQLAYWYNLHNVAVMYEIANAYPIKKIKSLVEGRKAVWDVKSMSIGGVPTSIRDIEEHVVNNWNDPLVLYGFFMGTVGGPNIMTTAFTGDNVIDSLQLNAVRFVNSLRGVKMWSGSARVSDHYGMGKHYFPNFQEDLMQHLLKYARPDTRRDLAKAKSLKIKNYDWGIADLKDGSVYNGSSFNTNPGSLAFFLQSTPGGTSTSAGSVNVAVNDSIFQSPAVGLNNHGGSIAPQTQALLRAVRLRNSRRLKQGEVTVEEFVDDEGGRVQRRNETAPAKAPPKDESEDNLALAD